MIPEESIKELEWIYQNGFVNDLKICGTDRILDAIREGIEALDKQIPESPLARLIVDDGTEVLGPFCPCCHSVVSRDEFYIQRCRCGKALARMIWDYTGKSK